MKNIYLIIGCLLSLTIILAGCQDEDKEFGDITAPTNLSLDFEIVGADEDNPDGDGSGFVNFSAEADNAITYQFVFGDGSDKEVSPSGNISHRFSLSGTNSYTVTVIATGTAGISTSMAVIIDVFSAFDDQNAKELLSGGNGSSKTWYLAASAPGHLGVGPSLDLDLQIDGLPNQFYFPAFFSAPPFDKCNDEISDCLCDDELTFSLDANGILTYQLDNMGQTFINGAHQQSAVGQSAGEDACFDFDTSFVSTVTMVPTVTDYSLVEDPEFSARGTTMNFSNEGFMGYYVSSFSYDIIEIDEDFLYVRTIDGLDPNLAWYHKFSTSPPDQSVDDTNFDNLVFEDNFDANGAPDASKWTIEEGTGSNGWGNNELQFYTDDPSNIIVEDGVLKITAIREEFMAQNYTSSRLKTENKFEFTYGRVEARAKLPEGGGTWPAIWMLGADFDQVSWPAAGEIDIMEHIGNNQNTIYSTLHYPGNSGGNGVGNSTFVDGVSDGFHIYEVIWTENTITFYVDGNQFHTFANSEDVPFNKDFFIIMNVAMGGNFGGNVDPSFTSSTMEIDYIKVFQ